jgi:hypothetical protein
MKQIATLVLFLSAFGTANAQITITASDMPVAGDTLRYSFASPVGSTIDLTDIGTAKTWNFAFTPIRQGVDTYRTATSVNLLYGLTIFSGYGYKVADSFPLPLPGISIQQVYTFFEKKSSPSRYQAQAFAAQISGIPTPINYSDPDEWYFFPLNYLNNDSSTYKLNISLPSIGGIKQVGYRKTTVDAWGTITTPFYTTPTNCIRVRSEIHEIDSVQFGTFPSIGFPRNSVEYKWLVNGDHYPALWVTTNVVPGAGTETISNIRYRDNPLPDTTVVDNHVGEVKNNVTVINAYPNPSVSGVYELDIPQGWQHYTIEVYDMLSKEVALFRDQKRIDISYLPSGRYMGRITSDEGVGYVQLLR